MTDQEEKIREERDLVGRSLRKAREERGLSLKKVQGAITVHAHHLKALELGDYEALPSPLWARGFLIMYANLLGLEGKRLADRVLPLRRSHRPRRVRRRRRRILLGALGIMIAAAGAAIVVAAILPFSDPATDSAAGGTGSVFLSSGPQRVAIFGLPDGETDDANNILVAEVADHKLGVLSIPRGTVAEIPGHGRGEIGGAVDVGGADAARRGVAQITDSEVRYYCLIDAEDIKRIVSAIDGVRVDIPAQVSGRASPDGQRITLRPGPQTLNGEQAIVYLYGGDLPGEAERAKRQQSFLNALFKQALGPANLFANPTTLYTMSESVETNMNAMQLIQLAGRVRELESSGMQLEYGALPAR